LPIFANRPAPRISGKVSFWIPSGKKTTRIGTAEQLDETVKLLMLMSHRAPTLSEWKDVWRGALGFTGLYSAYWQRAFEIVTEITIMPNRARSG
jgi:hypothetical protein